MQPARSESSLLCPSYRGLVWLYHSPETGFGTCELCAWAGGPSARGSLGGLPVLREAVRLAGTVYYSGRIQSHINEAKRDVASIQDEYYLTPLFGRLTVLYHHVSPMALQCPEKTKAHTVISIRDGNVPSEVPGQQWQVNKGHVYSFLNCKLLFSNNTVRDPLGTKHDTSFWGEAWTWLSPAKDPGVKMGVKNYNVMCYNISICVVLFIHCFHRTTRSTYNTLASCWVWAIEYGE